MVQMTTLGDRHFVKLCFRELFVLFPGSFYPILEVLLFSSAVAASPDARDLAKLQSQKSVCNADFVEVAMSTFQVDRFTRARPTRNKLLASLPPEDYERIAPHLRSVAMTLKQSLYKQDEPIQDVVFPNGGACSLVKTLQDGQAAEVASIGAEGVVGGSVFFGQRVAACDVVVQLPGPAADVMPANVFNAEMDRRGAFFNHVIRYNQALMSQIMQTTACNGLHSAEERCCRWLLMTHDRAGQDDFPLTHEFLALMLGVRRPTVTLVVASLSAAGLIESRRGSIRITDRVGLETASCECYQAVKATWRRLLPELDSAIA